MSPYAVTDYADLVRRLVVAYKDQSRAELVQPLGRLLAVGVEHVLRAEQVPAGAGVQLVPIPSSPTSVRRRGRDPVRDLACSAARLLRRRGRSVRVEPLVSQRRLVRDQAGLSAAERATNMHGALRARPAPATGPAVDPASAPVVRLVVDDVLTTGATVDEAVRVLLAAGWPVLAVATVAATRRHHQAPPSPPSSRGRPLSRIDAGG